MRKILIAVVAAATVGATVVSLSSTAEARWGRWGWGWGPGPFVGGLAAGAIIGGALAASPYAYYYYDPYRPYPYYYYHYRPGYGPPYGRPCGLVWNGYAWVPAC